MFQKLTRARTIALGMAAATVAATVVGVVAQPGSAAAGSLPGSGEWPMAGQNISDTHFQAAEHVISPANVGRLAPRWTLTTAGAVSATPAVADGRVYVPDYGGKLWAVAAGSGRVVWSQTISTYTGVAGDVSRVSPAVFGRDIILGDGWAASPAKSGAKVFAVNRRTGALDWITQVDTDPDAIVTGAPTIWHGVAYLGISSKGEGSVSPTFRGAVIALDAATGRLLWKAYTVPSDNGNSDSNLPGFYTGNAVWASAPAVDPARGLLYVGTGNNYSVPAGVCQDPGQTGCAQPVADDHLDSILALRLRDGSIAWADHTLDSDQWTVPRPTGPDFDFGSGANLFTVPGTHKQLLGIGQKNGVYWAVDPATGKVAWQTLVGPSVDPGHGIEWGTSADRQRVYVAEGDTRHQPYTLGGSGPFAGQTATAGSWAALDPATGKIIWQTPDPTGTATTAPVNVANGVVYGGSINSTATSMFAIDARTGAILWSFNSGGSVTGGAAIAAGSVYWGSGYCGTECFARGVPLNNNKVYAFSLR
ncbi:MAG TPA: PQQ-binding-like beta-propeller repeat protein [Pseudonocardiaceae bacterium]